jgi:hypothetical protein
VNPRENQTTTAAWLQITSLPLLPVRVSDIFQNKTSKLAFLGY